MAVQRTAGSPLRTSLKVAAAIAATIGLTTATLAPATAATPTGSSAGTASSSIKDGTQKLSSDLNILDRYGRPTPQTQKQVRDFANQPWMPKDARNAILSALAFYSGEGKGGPELSPLKGGPEVTQFYWPTVSGRCIDGRGDSVGSAIAVPGPTKIPAPGARSGETVFLFTALGTDPAAKKQGKMFVHWVNLDTLKTGATPLRNNGINPDGPATISGTAKTGKGTVVAFLSGTVKTKSTACSFVPTATVVDVK